MAGQCGSARCCCGPRFSLCCMLRGPGSTAQQHRFEREMTVSNADDAKSRAEVESDARWTFAAVIAASVMGRALVLSMPLPAPEASRYFNDHEVRNAKSEGACRAECLADIGEFVTNATERTAASL